MTPFFKNTGKCCVTSGPWYLKFFHGIELTTHEKLMLQVFSVSPYFVSVIHINIDDGKR